MVKTSCTYGTSVAKVKHFFPIVFANCYFITFKLYFEVLKAKTIKKILFIPYFMKIKEGENYANIETAKKSAEN